MTVSERAVYVFDTRPLIVVFVLPVNKQINDKERVAAAMENPNLREIVEQCVTEPDD